MRYLPAALLCSVTTFSTVGSDKRGQGGADALRRLYDARREMIVGALRSVPVDTALFAQALEDVDHLWIIYRHKEPCEIGYRPSHGQFSPRVRKGPDGRYYLLRHIYLNRAEGGPAPQEWLAQIPGLGKGGLVFESFGDLSFALEERVLTKRRELLRRAHERLKSGLLRLAKTYPQLNTGSGHYSSVEDADFPCQPDNITITCGHNNGYIGTREPIPAGAAYEVMVRIQPTQWGEIRQIPFERVFPNIDLEGMVRIWADDEDLNRELKELEAEALGPLKNLDDMAPRRAPR